MTHPACNVEASSRMLSGGKVDECVGAVLGGEDEMVVEQCAERGLAGHK